MVRSTRSFTLFLLTLCLAFVACKKEKEPEPDPAPAPQQGMLRLNFTFRKSGLTPYSLSDLITDSQGRYVLFDKVRFLVSNIRVLDLDGTVRKEFPGVVIKVDMANGHSTTHELGYMAEGQVGRIAFDVGLDDVNNALQPGDFSQPPLNDATLYQGPGLGYKFFELGGIWDSNNNLILGANDAPVLYTCVTSPMRRAKDMVVDTYHSQFGFTIPVKVYMANILNGISCASNASAVGAGPVNVQLMNNLQAAITMN